MATFELVAGDSGGVGRCTILDSATQEPVDLTGKTVQLRFSINGGATVERTMTISDQTTLKGKATYQFTSGDLSAGGEMSGEARLQDGLPDQLTTIDTFHIGVKTPLP